MGSIISKIADEIKLHGSWEAYCAFRDAEPPSPRTPLPVEMSFESYDLKEEAFFDSQVSNF